MTDVQIVRDRGIFPKGPLQAVGVAVYLRAEPGLTEPWLGHLISCQRAHVAVVGDADQASPLAIADAHVTVSTTYDGFRVTVTSGNSEVARAVVDRGQELAADTYGKPPNVASLR